MNFWRILGLPVRFAVTFGLGALLLAKIDLQEAHATLARVGYWTVVGSTVLLFFNTWMIAPRWQAVLRCYRVQLPRTVLLKLAIVGYFFNQVLPSNIGGDALRIWGLRQYGVALNSATRSVIIDRLFGLVTLFLFAAAGFSFILAESSDSSLRKPFLAILAVSVIAGLIFLLMLRFRGTQGFLRRLHFLFDFAHEIKVMILTPRVATPCLFYSAVGNLFPVFAVAWIAAPLGTNLTLVDYFAIVPAALLISVIPLSIAGWGVREAAMVVFMAEKGVPAETAVVIAVVFGIVMMLSALPGGLLWFFGYHTPNKGVWPDEATSPEKRQVCSKNN